MGPPQHVAVKKSACVTHLKTSMSISVGGAQEAFYRQAGLGKWTWRTLTHELLTARVKEDPVCAYGSI